MSRGKDDDQDGVLVKSIKDPYTDMLLYYVSENNNNKKNDALVTSKKESINEKRISVPTIVVGTASICNIMNDVVIYVSGERCIHLYASKEKDIIGLYELGEIMVMHKRIHPVMRVMYRYLLNEK